MFSTMGKQLTKQDLFEVVNTIVNKSNQDLLEVISESFSELEGRMATKTDLLSLATKIDLIEQRMATKADLAALETRMVSKDYLDKKLSDLHGNLLETIRKEDAKLGSLASKLADHKVLPVKEVREILAMEPFAKLS
jgi:hypothetical protein